MRPRYVIRTRSRELAHDRQIVTDEQQRELALVPHAAEQFHDLRLDRHVERADRLVGHQEGRIGRERARDADALPLAAGKLVRIALRMARIEADVRKAPRHLGLERGAGGEAVDRETVGDLRADPAARIEAAIRILEDDLHAPAQRAPVAPRDRIEAPALEAHMARGRFQQAEQQPAERALARARLADEADRLARPDVEIDIGHGAHRRARG